MNYNIIERMKEANKRPVIELDEGHNFTVNSSVPAVLRIQEIQEISKRQKENGGEYNEVDGVYDIIAVALGKEAVEYIKSQEYTFAALTLIIEAIMAAINNSTLEEVEEQNKQAPSK
ncbi:MAG: hypothetical protein E7214_14930 [Clostridium sp.]|nr:hypothetical protein [Clostridium sp.]